MVNRSDRVKRKTIAHNLYTTGIKYLLPLKEYKLSCLRLMLIRRNPSPWKKASVLNYFVSTACYLWLLCDVSRAHFGYMLNNNWKVFSPDWFTKGSEKSRTYMCRISTVHWVYIVFRLFLWVYVPLQDLQCRCDFFLLKKREVSIKTSRWLWISLAIRYYIWKVEVFQYATIY